MRQQEQETKKEAAKRQKDDKLKKMADPFNFDYIKPSF